MRLGIPDTIVRRTLHYMLHYGGMTLTHWGRVTHICVGNLTNIGSDNGLSPGRRRAIIWTNAGILLIRTLGTNFSEISSAIHTSSFKKMHLKRSSAKWCPVCLGLNVLNAHSIIYVTMATCHITFHSIHPKECSLSLRRVQGVGNVSVEYWWWWWCIYASV